MDSNNKNLITPIIKGRKVVYHLVTDEDLSNLKSDNIFQDILMVVFSVVFGIAITKGDFGFFLVSLIILLLVIIFYYKKISFIKRTKKSAEIDIYKDTDKTTEKTTDEKKFVIKEAVYFSNTVSKDITNEVKNLSQDDKLLFNGKYNDIAGDPDKGKHKKLQIKYLYDGVAFSKTFNEDEPINLP